MPAAEFDHGHPRFDRVLKARVRDGLVDYQALKASPGDLDGYLAELAAVNEPVFDKWTAPQRLAFLINLYNAATLRLIADHYPIKSIKKIGGLFRGPWDQPVVRLFGRTITLDVLEHQILRVQFDEPRLHFAIVCAARGCPPLRAEAYTAGQLEQQLNDQGKVFLRTASKNSVDLPTRTLTLSPIFKWFAADFERGHGSVIRFVAPFFPDRIRRELDKSGWRVKYSAYDWSLNEAAGIKK